MDYAVLAEKLARPEKQSWYFRQARAQQQERKTKLAVAFEEIRKEFNVHTLDDLLAARKEQQEQLDQIYARPGIGLILQIAVRSIKARLQYLDEMIALKGRIATLHPVAYYLNHPDDFLKLADWEAFQ